jgi:hypothetical protein
MGLIDSLKHASWKDRIGVALGFVGIAMVGFFFGIVQVLFFGVSKMSLFEHIAAMTVGLVIITVASSRRTRFKQQLFMTSGIWVWGVSCCCLGWALLRHLIQL